jgi:Precorrin-6x reductase
MSADTHNPEREKILILGGTADARERAARLVARGHHVITSLAGRTTDPFLPAGEVRIGGFGGPEGLARYLFENGITRVIDATHPFAHRISENARIACAAAGVPLEQLARPAWGRQPDDDWIEVTSLEDAAAALPAEACVFLALGRQYLSAFESRQDCHFVVRMVDPPGVPLGFASFDLILGKPSSDPSEEQALLEAHRITHLVCRNSGGEAGYGKIVAARQLGIPVIMIGR